MRNHRRTHWDFALIGRLAGWAVLATGYALGGVLLFAGFVLAFPVIAAMAFSAVMVGEYDENRQLRFRAALRGFAIAARSFSLGIGGPTRRRT